MRGQQTTLTSLLFSSLIYIFFLGSAIFYVAESAPNLTSRNVDNAATTVMTSKTKLNSDDHSKISSQASPKVLKANVCGSFCGKTFYPAIDVSEVTQRACPKILKAKNSKPSRLGGLRAHGPNLPYSYYNFPNSYTGPKEFFYAQKPLFLWPIVSNRARKIFGLKGNDRVVISVSNENKCEYQGVVRKNLFKWTKCLPGCTWIVVQSWWLGQRPNRPYENMHKTSQILYAQKVL